jgi:hypothetical protein
MIEQRSKILSFSPEIIIMIIEIINFESSEEMRKFALVCGYFLKCLKETFINLNIKYDSNIFFYFWYLKNNMFESEISYFDYNKIKEGNLKNIQINFLFRNFKVFHVKYKKLGSVFKEKKYIVPKINLRLLDEFCYYYDGNGTVVDFKNSIFFKVDNNDVLSVRDFIDECDIKSYFRNNYFCYLFNNIIFDRLVKLKLFKNFVLH